MPDLRTHTQVGKSSLQVPLLAFGTAALATAPAWDPGEPIPVSQSDDTLVYAYEQGIRWFDTAPNYGAGLAETRTGRVIAQLPSEQFILSTKVGFVIRNGESCRDYSRDGVWRSLEGSLKRLGVDAIDLLYVHDPDTYAEQVLSETFPALAALREQGVIKAIGAGMNQWQVPLLFAQHADFDCFMIASRWTLLEQGAMPLLEVCAQKGISVFAASIYNSGILAVGARSLDARYNHAPADSSIRERVRRIEDICAEFNVSLHTAATQYPLAHPAIQALVVGFQRMLEVRACLGALDQQIPAALWKRLQTENLISHDAPLPKVV